MTMKTSAKRAGRTRGGRPSLPAAERRDQMIRVMATEVECLEISRAAARDGAPVSVWLRTIALERARGR